MHLTHCVIDFYRQPSVIIANGRVGSDASVGDCMFVGSGGTSISI